MIKNILLVACSSLVALFLMSIMLEKQEITECRTWQQQAKHLPSYYITAWQFAQCEHYNIYIKAPIK